MTISLDALYRLQDKIGDKLSDLELINNEALTGDKFDKWQNEYKRLEKRFNEIENIINKKEKIS